MTSPILYSFRRCPYAMRARLALFYTGMEFELREIILRDKPDHMLKISPKGTVPVLLLPDGQVIDESLDIMTWALKQNAPCSWSKNVDRTLIKQNDGPFKHNLDRYKYPNRYDEDCSNARRNALEIIQNLNDRLAQNKHLGSDQPNLTDYAIFPFIRQFANVDREWWQAQDTKPIQNWLKHHLDSPLFQSIMEKYPQWTPDISGNMINS